MAVAARGALEEEEVEVKMVVEAVAEEEAVVAVDEEEAVVVDGGEAEKVQVARSNRPITVLGVLVSRRQTIQPLLIPSLEHAYCTTRERHLTASKENFTQATGISPTVRACTSCSGLHVNELTVLLKPVNLYLG